MRDLQEQIRLFCLNCDMVASPEVRILDVASELGEVSKEVLKGTDYGRVPFEKTDDLEEELGDLLFSLIQFANESRIDLDESLKAVMRKYEKRIKEKGDASSGR